MSPWVRSSGTSPVVLGAQRWVALPCVPPLEDVFQNHWSCGTSSGSGFSLGVSRPGSRSVCRREPPRWPPPVLAWAWHPPCLSMPSGGATFKGPELCEEKQARGVRQRGDLWERTGDSAFWQRFFKREPPLYCFWSFFFSLSFVLKKIFSLKSTVRLVYKSSVETTYLDSGCLFCLCPDKITVRNWWIKLRDLCFFSWWEGCWESWAQEVVFRDLAPFSRTSPFCLF